MAGATGAPGPIGPQGPAGPTNIVVTVNTSFSLDDRAGWVHIEDVGDDQCLLNIPLGFTYTGFGANTALVSVSSNGNLFFGQGCTNALSNTPLPTPLTNDAMLAFFWDDLKDFGSNEFMEYQTFGQPGARVFFLYFRMRLFAAACGSDAQNIVVAVHEGSNLLEVTYSGFSGCANMRGASATFGIQSAGRTKYVNVGADVPLLDDNAARQTISYQPPAS